MPQEPKRRHSRGRKGKRRASIHLTGVETVKCGNCGSPVLAHSVCKNCGFYKGKEIVSKRKTKVVENEKSS
mgnify:CR=1 FL=1